MNTRTIINPETIDLIPCDWATFPRVGPITTSSTIVVGAGKVPALRIFAKSCASSIVKLPVICELPLGISFWTNGAE